MSLATCLLQRSTCIRMSGECGAVCAATLLTTRHAAHRPLLDGRGTQQQEQHIAARPALGPHRVQNSQLQTPHVVPALTAVALC